MWFQPWNLADSSRRNTVIWTILCTEMALAFWRRGNEIVEHVPFVSLLVTSSYTCWWFRNQAITTWLVWNPVNNGICTISTGSPDFSINSTLPRTNSSPLKMGHPKRKGSSSDPPFSGASKCYLQGVCGCFLKRWHPTTMGLPTKNDHFGVWNGDTTISKGNPLYDIQILCDSLQESVAFFQLGESMYPAGPLGGWWSAATQTIQLLNRVMTHDMTCWMVIFFRNRQTNEYIYIFTILIFDEVLYVKSVLTGKLRWILEMILEDISRFLHRPGNFIVLVLHVRSVQHTPRSVRSVYEGSPSVFCFCLGGGVLGSHSCSWNYLVSKFEGMLELSLGVRKLISTPRPSTDGW